ncbi:hypothetical protein QYE76_003263 [Lolium multiflorum]|uniref:Integrase catalytic domain-containing protein n=1 Tax=Lolium multiflorum TaxID=4521 RepID=A0AAD8RND2_LOLMU|nr:hypothetical protein QYE76_003263 [Lolium multiflorum]
MAQQGEDESVLATLECFSVRARQSFDHVFVYGAGGGQWRCLARYGKGVECARASGWEGKDEGVQSRRCTAASSDTPMHALARPNAVITAWPRLVVHGLEKGSCLACSVPPDNGSNFTSKEFKAYCAEVGIKLSFASVAHPQTNGQVEKANGIICNGIKKRLLGPLEKARHTWPEELPSVLWSIRTTPNTATHETPFFLVHGAEAVLPIEIEHDAPRVTEYDEETSRKALEDDVDALDEARDEVLSRVAKYQQDLKNYHSRRLRPRSFQVGDLVLRLNQKSHEKLESPWLGPYIVTEVIEGGAYRIKDKKTGIAEPNPWNVAQLRRFYA